MGGNAVVVVNYGSAELVEENLGPLSAVRSDLRVVVVDSFSSDDEQRRVAQLGVDRGWTTVLLPENAGFGGGVNRGVEAALEAGASAVLVVNPDARLDAADAAALLAAALEGDARDVVAPVIRRPDGTLWSAGTDLYLDDGSMAGVRHRAVHAGRPREFWVSGACFAISADLWRLVGGLDEAYFLYWEDVDFTWRVRAAGGRVRILDTASAVHDEGGTHDDQTAGRAKSETFYYYNIRNRMLFAQRWLDEATARRWRRTALRTSWGILLQGGRRQLITSVAPWRALIRGLRDGRRGITGPRA